MAHPARQTLFLGFPGDFVSPFASFLKHRDSVPASASASAPSSFIILTSDRRHRRSFKLTMAVLGFRCDRWRSLRLRLSSLFSCACRESPTIPQTWYKEREGRWIEVQHYHLPDAFFAHSPVRPSVRSSSLFEHVDTLVLHGHCRPPSGLVEWLHGPLTVLLYDMNDLVRKEHERFLHDLKRLDDVRYSVIHPDVKVPERTTYNSVEEVIDALVLPSDSLS